MFPILSVLRHASGLSRLLELQSKKLYLFQGSRISDPLFRLYPLVHTISSDPDRVRGFWVPSVGLLPPLSMVTYVFANALVAAASALTQGRDGVCPVRIDDFSDGTIAVFFGENQVTQGIFHDLVGRVASLNAAAPLGEYFVNVVGRDQFPRDRLDFPMPGAYVSTDVVPVEERVSLTAGDARALSALLDAHWISFADPKGARRDPFTGHFAHGGHLQFDPLSGDSVAMRIPTEADRRSALSRAGLRGQRWLQRTMGQPLYGVESTSQRQNRSAAQPRSTVGQALKFIEERCSEPITIAEIAEAAQLSTRHLHVIFREVLGCTPLGYAAERRLDLAENLIKGTALSMSVIAERCGFAEQASLTRSLKRRRGITPMALRKSARFQDKR